MTLSSDKTKQMSTTSESSNKVGINRTDIPNVDQSFEEMKDLSSRTSSKGSIGIAVETSESMNSNVASISPNPSPANESVCQGTLNSTKPISINARMAILERQVGTLNEETKALKEIMTKISTDVFNQAKFQRVYNVISLLESGKYDLQCWFQDGALYDNHGLVFIRNRQDYSSPVKCCGYLSSFLAHILGHFHLGQGYFIDGVSFEPEYSECDEVALCMREEAFRRDLVEFITAAVGSRPKLMPREYRFVIYL